MSDMEGRGYNLQPKKEDGAVPDNPQSGVARTPFVGQFTSTELKLDISLIEWAFVSFFHILVFMLMFMVCWCGLRLRDRRWGITGNACVMVVLVHIQ
jgi:hypothetical protein